MKVLVTGATGFVGGYVARRLQEQGVQVTALGRNITKGQALQRLGIIFTSIALEDRQGILNACKGHAAIIHCGALSSAWGRPHAFYLANVAGTRHIVEGALANQVERLIHISTPSLYFLYETRLNVKETDSLPAKPANEYVRTKLMAETIVDAAVQQGLFAITLRPRAIYGPGDQTILPRIIEALQRKRLPVIGTRTNVADFTYIDNLVDVIITALSASPALCGQKYNITNGEPAALWQTIDQLCESLSLPKPQRHITSQRALMIAGWLEHIFRLLPGYPEPPLTRYIVSVLATSQTLNIEAARTDLGYIPAISNTGGLDKFVEWWRVTKGTE